MSDVRPVGQVPMFGSSEVQASEEENEMTDPMRDLLRDVVEMANDFNFELENVPSDVRMEMVRQRIAENDVVFAVWQDQTEPHGVGSKLVKGQHLMRQMIADNKSLPLRVTGIKCIDVNQAESLKRIEGEWGR
jgi:hypothetical protein